MNIVLLAEAKSLGLTHYYTGKPCKHGHLCERKVIDRGCVECNKQKSKRHGNKAREWYHNNKERAQDRARTYYQNNKEKAKERARAWESKNPERTLELKRNWRRSDRGREQSRDWTSKNRDAHYVRTKDWKSRNLDKVYEYTGTRRAAKLQATPQCQTKEDRKEMLAFYREAKRLEKETGIKHHVDHIVPLQHENFCGLHVPWNLQVLTESENTAKGNKYGD